MGERKIGLVATVAVAVAVFAGASVALLIFDPRTTGADALRTGGLAAGSVVALYALWLNDRRRRVEEKRQELDSQRQELDRQRYALEQQRQALEDRRTDQDRDRAADERFARSVELLGNDADQVRVGAMHALAGLARSNPDYTQTVLDVLCSYLRRPFVHPKWTPASELPADPGEWPEASPEQEGERYVRQTAQRLIQDLLPSTADPDPKIYELDLTRAWLERFNLSDRVVGRIAAYRCRFRHTTNFNRAVFHGPVHLRDSVFVGRIRAEKTRFRQRLELRGIATHGPCGFERAEFEGAVDMPGAHCIAHVSFERASFRTTLDLRHARFDGGVDLRVGEPLPSVALYNTEVDTSTDAQVPEGWSFEPCKM
ncbi:pentapeptide repeat-containing protein [Saccharopolyspora sp. NPDC050642]|uniref:pentapeptide repeat-containing protein n=1 Tax=Saccharopolyspora sp. NPDC050642 TaxID=3157099 RepID=UPI0033CF1CE6